MTALDAPAASDRPPQGPRRRVRVWEMIVAVVLLVAGAVAVIVWQQRARWHQVWHDEFDGRAVSRSQWNVRDASWSTNEESIDTDRPVNVQVVGGQLRITARRERYTVGRTTRAYTSGYLDTVGRASWRYGRFEMRAKLPTSVGLWPAFWLRADHGKGEIDVLEAVGGNPGRTIQTVHRSTDGGPDKVGHVDHLAAGSTAEWHTYSLQLEPERLTWRIDDEVVFEVRSDQAPWLRESFDEPVNIRLNLQVGGALPAYYASPVTAATAFPARLVVDWVRVYQYN